MIILFRLYRTTNITTLNFTQVASGIYVMIIWHILNIGHGHIQRLNALGNITVTQLEYNYVTGQMVGLGPSLLWRHNGLDGVSNHQLHDFLLNGLFRRRPKKTSKLRVTGFLWGINGDRWINSINGQWRGKCFHLITSSCNCLSSVYIWPH